MHLICPVKMRYVNFPGRYVCGQGGHFCVWTPKSTFLESEWDMVDIFFVKLVNLCTSGAFGVMGPFTPPSNLKKCMSEWKIPINSVLIVIY